MTAMGGLVDDVVVVLVVVVDEFVSNTFTSEITVVVVIVDSALRSFNCCKNEHTNVQFDSSVFLCFAQNLCTFFIKNKHDRM